MGTTTMSRAMKIGRSQRASGRSEKALQRYQSSADAGDVATVLEVLRVTKEARVQDAMKLLQRGAYRRVFS